jgi:hypothetical protein
MTVTRARPTADQVTVIERRLLERPDDIRAAARGFAKAFKEQADELRRSKPNEPDRLAQWDDLIAFFEKMAAGLGDLADALDQAFKTPVAAAPSEPIFLGKAAEIAHQLQLGAIDWLEKNRTVVIDVPIRFALLCGGISFLHWLDADSIQAIAALGWLARSRGSENKKKKPLGKKKGGNRPSKKAP